MGTFPAHSPALPLTYILVLPGSSFPYTLSFYGAIQIVMGVMMVLKMETSYCLMLWPQLESVGTAY